MNILIAGVGGQGTILAGKVISRLALDAGYEVKVAEIHGMSQRGGSVVTQVRFDKEVFAPLIGQGQADLLLAFEMLEGLRLIDQLKPEGRAVVNTRQIMPMPVLAGVAEYPTDIEAKIKAKREALFMDAYQLALEAGSDKAVNIVLLGKLSQTMDFSEEAWLNAIAATVKPQFVELNHKAFLLGRNA